MQFSKSWAEKIVNILSFLSMSFIMLLVHVFYCTPDNQVFMAEIEGQENMAQPLTVLMLYFKMADDWSTYLFYILIKKNTCM